MKQFAYLKFLAFPLVFLFRVSCNNSVERNARMIIFVHGTIKPAEFSFSSLIKIMQDEVDNTLYSQAIHYMRQDKSFYHAQAMQERGLKEINLSSKEEFNTARTVALMYDLQLTQLGQTALPRRYYTFGWNGLLSDSKRYQEAVFFYGELLRELEKLALENINPSIEIIAYSHGANVSLYLPAARDAHNSYRQKPLEIERLISLAAPIQRETDHLISDPLFKKVYHLYSTEDNIQILDLFSSHQLFPKRIFTKRKGFKVPDKLQQVRIRVTKEIKWRHKAQEINVPHEILQAPGIRLIHKDPGHTEMWNFQWGAYWYRDSFPLKPLPVMAFLPSLIDAVDRHAEHKHLTFDYAPTERGVLLKNKKLNFKKALAFMEPETHNELWKIARDNEPIHYTLELQQQQIAAALEKAQRDLLRANQYRKPRNKILANYMKQISLGIFDRMDTTQKLPWGKKGRALRLAACI